MGHALIREYAPISEMRLITREYGMILLSVKWRNTLLKILKEVTTPPKVRKSQAPKQRLRLAGDKQNVIIAMSTAILCKNRHPSMCLLQKIISLILQAGRSSKQVCVSIFLLLLYIRLNDLVLKIHCRLFQDFTKFVCAPLIKHPSTLSTG